MEFFFLRVSFKYEKNTLSLYVYMIEYALAERRRLENGFFSFVPLKRQEMKEEY